VKYARGDGCLFDGEGDGSISKVDEDDDAGERKNQLKL
jgi:hypothetical protein